MTLVNLTHQPLAYLKGYAEALAEVAELDDKVASTEGALSQCLDLAHDARQIYGFAPSADIREGGMGQAQAFSECAEAYRQLGEIYGWASAPGLGDFISWRHSLAQGLIDKAKS